MKYRNITYSLIFTGLLLSLSCQQETALPPGPPDGKTVELTFNVTPGGIGTKAMDNELESQITEIDVLVFKEGFFHYYAQADPQTIENTGTGLNPYTKKEFRVKLTTDEAPNNILVVIANAHQSLVNADNAGKLTSGSTKNEVLKNIVFENEDRWPARLDGTTYARPIPMYGESDPGKINKDLEQNLMDHPIPLYRALTRIDVSLENSVRNFELTQVYFYRYNKRGCVAPGPNADFQPHPVSGEQRVRNVTLPADPATQTEANGYLRYDIQGSSNASIGEIYVLEADRAANDDYVNASCLIVAGKYNNTDAVTYYRIDFEIVWNVNGEPVVEAGRLNESYPRVFARILRNHVYDIKISEVTKAGAESLEKARSVSSESDNGMEVEAAAWTTKSLNIVF